MIRYLLLMLALLLLPVPVAATIYTDCNFDSAPTSEDDGGVYSCDTGSATLNLENLAGTVFDHVTGSACFGGTGGCAKFYSHTSLNYSYREFWLNSVAAGTQRNIRFLIKFEGNYFNTDGDYAGKFLEGYPLPSWRNWVSFGVRSAAACEQTAIQPELSFEGTLAMAHGQEESSNPCSEYYWCANSSWGEGWPASVSACTFGSQSHIDIASYTGQWISIELERNSSGHYKLYLTTTDNVHSGLYYDIDTTFSGDIIGWATLGAYLEGQSGSYVGDKYFMIDSLVQSDSYIGPPAGFTGTTAKSIIGITITGGAHQ